MSGAIHLTNRITASQVARITLMHGAHIPQNIIAKEYDISGASVGRILDVDSWSKVQCRVWGTEEPQLPVIEPDDITYEGSIPSAQLEPEVRIRPNLMAQVRMFDKIKTDLEDNLADLRAQGSIKPAFYNEMIDEMVDTLLDTLLEWKHE